MTAESKWRKAESQILGDLRLLIRVEVAKVWRAGGSDSPPVILAANGNSITEGTYVPSLALSNFHACQ